MTSGAFVAIINSENKILLVRRNYGQRTWTMPGGAIEPKESPMQAAIREVAEETGLKIELKDLIGLYYRQDKDDLVIFFLGKAAGGEIRQPDRDEEISELGYFSPDELPAPMSYTAIQRVKDAFEYSGKTFLRDMTPKEGDNA